MPNVLIFDLESNGLLDTADRLWVAATPHVCLIQKEAQDITAFLKAHTAADGIIAGHNIIDYDLPLLNKLFGYEHKGKVLDTLVLSRLLNPKRKGGHGLEAWGVRFGVPKPPIEDWTKWNDKMPHRCKEDVRINTLTLDYLLKEG